MKNKTTAYFLLAGVSALSVAAFAGETPQINFDQGINLGDVTKSLKGGSDSSSVPATTAPKSLAQNFTERANSAVKPAPKEWTVMIYMNGKNDLETFALKNANDMEKVGSTSKVNIVVELGRMQGYDSSDGNWTGSRRMLIIKDNNPNKITSPVVQTIKDADMGNWEHLVDFATWARAGYPAKRYMLIIWNHGSGWKSVAGKLGFKDFQRDAGNPVFQTEGISYDEATGHHISTVDMGKAFAKIGGVDLFATDACLMQTIEVAYEIRNYAPVIVGSEETEPGDGYDYTAFLKALTANPGSSPQQTGQFVVETYKAFYTAKHQTATYSEIVTSALGGLAQRMSAFADAVKGANEGPVVKNALAQAQRFADPDSKDLYNFVQLVLKDSKDSSVQSAGNDLMSYVSGTLVTDNGVVNLPNAHGMAVYLPNYTYDGSYAGLAFAKDSKWADFVNWILQLK